MLGLLAQHFTTSTWFCKLGDIFLTAYSYFGIYLFALYLTTYLFAFPSQLLRVGTVSNQC